MIPWFCTAHNIATSKMALFAKKACLSHDRKGRFRCIKEINCRKRVSWVLVTYKKKGGGGRRVVVLYQLPKSLDSGCNTCAEPLKLSSMITDKTLSGLGSFLYITCCNPDFGEIHVCHTNKTQRVNDTSRGQPNFDLNTNAAANPDSFYLICVRIVVK